MIHYTTGNLLLAPTEALVNTVNTVGVMGKGIALQFKEKYPTNFAAYARAVKQGEVMTGKMFVSVEQQLDGRKVIINFPTKQHWRAPSRYEWIEAGLQDLVRVIEELGIRTIAIPPLGCGNGGLDWERVRGMMERYLASLPETDVYIHQPNQKIRETLAKEGQPKSAHLTTVRAELLYLLFYYETSGEESSLFVANKLAYFLQRLGEKQLKLRFERHHYGPYANQVDHLMYALNGTYLQGLEQRTAKAFDRLPLRYDQFETVNQYVKEKLSEEQRLRLQQVLDLVQGFESPLSLEALATVDSILQEEPEATTQQVLAQIHQWSERKQQLFDLHHVEVTYQRLRSLRGELGYEGG
jgi:O-acetyl-ADP-ribose deacetylase (regulator of RNase III)